MRKGRLLSLYDMVNVSLALKQMRNGALVWRAEIQTIRKNSRLVKVVAMIGRATFEQ